MPLTHAVLGDMLPNMLDWPFLFTIFLIFGLSKFKQELSKLLARGRISLTLVTRVSKSQTY